MPLSRRHTPAQRDAFDGLPTREVMDEESGVFTLPRDWQGGAAALAAGVVFCRAPLPAHTRPAGEAGVPPWLQPRVADESRPYEPVYENDIRDAVRRVAGGAAHAGWTAGIFEDERDARAFYDDACRLLLRRVLCPEAGIWARAGARWAYGVHAGTPRLAQETASPLEGRDAMTQLARLAQEGAPAAMMQAEHVDSPRFISWKSDAEADILARNMGRRLLRGLLRGVMEACDRDDPDNGFHPRRNPALAQAVEAARRAGAGEAAIRAAIGMAREGYDDIPLPAPREDDADAGPAIATILSVPDAFIENALTGHGFMLRQNGEGRRHVSAGKLWDRLGHALWASGAPHVFFRDAAGGEGPLLQSRSGGLVMPREARAPCAAIDLLAFVKDGRVDTRALERAASVAVILLDPCAQAPLRPLVVSLANIAAALMAQGLAYDSDAGRATAALCAAIATGAALRASARMAARAGAMTGWEDASPGHLQRMKEALDALSGTAGAARGPRRAPARTGPAACADEALGRAAKAAMAQAWELARAHGLRHAHVTAIDTPGEAQALLDAPARDIAPLEQVVRPLPGGGRALAPPAEAGLRALGYGAAEQDAIRARALGRGTLAGAPCVNPAALRERGLPQWAVAAVEQALRTARDIRHAFTPWVLGEEARGLVPEGGEDDILSALGFTEEDIAAANLWCCGTGALADAPELEPAHRAVFAHGPAVCAEAQIRMQAAVEPFLSGGVAHTLALPQDAAIADVQRLLLRGWELGVKSLRLYRASSSLLSPALPVEMDADAGARDAADRPEETAIHRAAHPL